MSVRKRTWTTSKGEQKEAWIVDYIDQDGERHIQTFSARRMPTSTTRRSRSTCARASTPREQEAHRRRGGGRLDRIRGARRARAVDRRPISPARGPPHQAAHRPGEAGEADDAAHQGVPRRPAGEHVPRHGEEGADQPQVAAARMRSGAATSRRTSRSTSRSASTSAASASSRWASTSRPRRRSSASSTPQPAASAAAADGGLHRAAELRIARPALGATSTSSAASCTCASGRTATTRSASRSRNRVSAPSRSGRSCSTR